jgi:phage tail-like protein
VKNTVEPWPRRTPFPLADTLPGVYRGTERTEIADASVDKPIVVSLCEAFDEVLAPIFAVLDDYPAYLDAGTAPDQMLEWLGSWIGYHGYGTTPKRLRTLIAQSAQMSPNRGESARSDVADGETPTGPRGTMAGIKGELDASFGFTRNQSDVRIEPRPAKRRNPNATLDDPTENQSNDHAPWLIVTITAPEGDDRHRIEWLVNEIKPAHLPHRVEYAGLDPAGQPTEVFDQPTQLIRQVQFGPEGVHGERNPPS